MPQSSSTSWRLPGDWGGGGYRGRVQRWREAREAGRWLPWRVARAGGPHGGLSPGLSLIADGSAVAIEGVQVVLCSHAGADTDSPCMGAKMPDPSIPQEGAEVSEADEVRGELTMARNVVGKDRPILLRRAEGRERERVANPRYVAPLDLEPRAAAVGRVPRA